MYVPPRSVIASSFVPGSHAKPVLCSLPGSLSASSTLSTPSANPKGTKVKSSQLTGVVVLSPSFNSVLGAKYEAWCPSRRSALRSVFTVPLETGMMSSFPVFSSTAIVMVPLPVTVPTSLPSAPVSVSA